MCPMTVSVTGRRLRAGEPCTTIPGMMRVMMMVLLLGAVRVAAEPTHAVLLEAVEGREPGLHRVGEGQPADSFPSEHTYFLNEQDILYLRGGAIVDVTDQRPDEPEVAFGAAIAFSPAGPEIMYECAVDYDAFTEFYTDVTDLRTFPLDGRDVPPIVRIFRKSGLFTVKALLHYDYEPPHRKSWRLATEADLEAYPEDQRGLMDRFRRKTDFTICKGSWSFYASSDPVLRYKEGVTVLQMTVDLQGFKARIKPEEKLQQAVKGEMPRMISDLHSQAQTVKRARGSY